MIPGVIGVLVTKFMVMTTIVIEKEQEIVSKEIAIHFKYLKCLG